MKKLSFLFQVFFISVPNCSITSAFIGNSTTSTRSTAVFPKNNETSTSSPPQRTTPLNPTTNSQTPLYIVEETISNSTDAELNILTSTLAPPPENPCKCGLADFATGKIVGGTAVDDMHSWPWFATLVRNDRLSSSSSKSAHCGASLISSRHVVTAAHCLVPMIQFGLRNFNVKLGYNDLRDSGRNQDKLDIPIESVTIHPRFEQSSPYHYDIGLVKLAYAIDCKKSKRIRPICLPSSGNDDSFVNETAITAGFGRTSINGNHSSVLQQIQLEVIANTECEYHFTKLPFQSPKILDSMLCAWRKGVDSCVGDSGGPLFLKLKQQNSSHYIQIGITSWGIGCANERYPGVYTRLEKYISWIKTVALDLS